MDAGLRFQPTIRIVAANLQSCRLDPRLLAWAFVNSLDFETPRLGPSQIHAKQHFCPILRFCAAGTGMNLEIAIIGIRLA